MNLYDKIDFILFEEKVDSSMINSIDYDQSIEELIIEFKNGSKYKYFKVPIDVWEEFKTASSKGKFFWADIRDVYDYQKIS